MKKTLIALALIVATQIKSQVFVDNVNINEVGGNYCDIVGYESGLIKKKTTVFVDYGQKTSISTIAVITGADKKTVVFNTIIDALNFMDKNGWSYVSNYAVSTNEGIVYHYLLKKK